MRIIHFEPAYRKDLVRYFGRHDSPYDLHRGDSIHLKQLPESYPTDNPTGRDVPLAYLRSHFIEPASSTHPIVQQEQAKLEERIHDLLLQLRMPESA